MPTKRYQIKKYALRALPIEEYVNSYYSSISLLFTLRLLYSITSFIWLTLTTLSLCVSFHLIQ